MSGEDIRRSHRVFIGLGSNLGDRHGRMRAALRLLDEHPQVTLEKRTAFVETEPWGVLDQPVFLNAVALLTTTFEPHALLAELKRIEKELGRKERNQKWGPREIDLDILLFGDMVIKTDNLVIPHVRLVERPFVVVQLLEIDENIQHPVYHVPMKDFLSLD
jgi:2-amino-4-hydroxy-6-hydroxymethyldihydropteridine diphosphokinase